MKFKVGDKVKYISDVYADSESNPLWGGKFGKVIGVIVNIRGGIIDVGWPFYGSNSYFEEDLGFISKKSNHPLTKIFV